MKEEINEERSRKGNTSRNNCLSAPDLLLHENIFIFFSEARISAKPWSFRCCLFACFVSSYMAGSVAYCQHQAPSGEDSFVKWTFSLTNHESQVVIGGMKLSPAIIIPLRSLTSMILHTPHETGLAVIILWCTDWMQ